MKNTDPVAVSSRAFSKNPTLRAELTERYEKIKFNEAGRHLPEDELVEFLRGFPRAIISLERVDDRLLSRLPELKVISKYGVGLDNIDFTALERRGIRLGWEGGVNRRSVSELALCFAIASLRKVNSSNLELRSGKWNTPVGGLLSSRTVGIIGCGHIGKDLVTLLRPFGCRILAHDIRSFPEFYSEHGVQEVSLDALLAEADVVTLHVPLDASTRLFMSEKRLRQMKEGAVLVNTARGNLVDEGALKALLKEGRLGAAAFDVFGIEPPEDRELIALPNFLCTPHVGGSAAEAILAMGRSAMRGLESALPIPEFLAKNGL